MNTNVIGLDLAKNIFHLFSFNSEGKPMKKKVKRTEPNRAFGTYSSST
jgi:transposase